MIKLNKEVQNIKNIRIKQEEEKKRKAAEAKRKAQEEARKKAERERIKKENTLKKIFEKF
ncbi:hypothetical protein HOG21_01365 [bacterium]|jgi:colicin import membrane protein|nr:hypothetical protein [bacterium]